MAKRTDKYNRLQQLTGLLATHPEGLRKAEIARRIGVHRSTVGRYIDQLSLNLPLWERDKRIGIEADAAQNESPKFNLYEGTFLLSLIRLYQQEMSIKNPHVSSVARKLSAGFKTSSPTLSESFSAAAEEIDNEDSLISGTHIKNFEKLSRAWVMKQAVEINYLHSSTGESCAAVFEPDRFFSYKSAVDSSDLALHGTCRRTGEICSLKISDFTEIQYPVVDMDIEMGYQSLFCPVSEFALSQRPVMDRDEQAVLDFKESNHRIKNSLFMVSGLIDVTFSDLMHDDVQKRTKQLQGRIELIAQIHEQLTRGDGRDCIRLKPFINELVDRIFGFAVFDGHFIKKKIRISDISLESHKALPFGMVLSELLLNSFKHTAENEDGSISISITGSNGTVRLRYRDGGPGFRLKADSNTCGTTLIDSFCRQLNCTVSNKNKYFILEFPV